ncbi:MAG TPA: TauD/TfdA family dioxygenase [Steroidobacteraceae bacterium]|nr:TauD/TfdA family dioxygenase [Steroidobacteraceae bacterium]
MGRKTLAARESSMADLAPLETARALAGIEFSADGITLRWDDGHVDRLQALWLRDNCACSQCRHPRALERIYMFIDHAAPSIVSALQRADGMLEVHFQADMETHVSRYTRGWLRAQAEVERATRQRQAAPSLWDAEIARRLPCVDYREYMESNEGLRTWIEAVRLHGIVLLRNVPRTDGKLLDVAHRIGPVRASNFGEYYDVVSKPNPNASAYTAMGLELHTDLANWRSPPDVQLLFCLENSARGGESVFADGFRVAEDLRDADPEAFRLLSTHAIEYRFHDPSCDIRTAAPVIELDRQGRLARVRFNNWLRGVLEMPQALVVPMYEALGKFWRMLRDPKYRLNLRLEPGDLISYNNNRVLHGRAPFDETSGERHLQGCYLNQEDVDSALRLLDRVTA